MNTNKKTVTIDEQTLVGNSWIKPWAHKKFGAYNKVMYTKDAASDFTADTDGVAFFISQLAHLETTIYQTLYADIVYLEDIPVMGGVPEHANEWVYRSFDAVTLGKFIGASAKDLPSIQMQAQKNSVPIAYGGNYFEYSLEELRTQAYLGMPIDSLSAELALRASQEHLQRVAYFGDLDRNMHGLFNHPNVTVTNASKNIDAMSGQELFDLINDQLFEVSKSSVGRHRANTVLVYPKLMNTLNKTLMTGYTDTTVLKFLLDNNIYTLETRKPLEIKMRFQLDADNLSEAGVKNNSKERFMVYEKLPQNLGCINNIPFRLTAPQTELLCLRVAGEYKGSGTEFRYPLCARYVDAA